MYRTNLRSQRLILFLKLKEYILVDPRSVTVLESVIQLESEQCHSTDPGAVREEESESKKC